jgi:Helix-turn-helix domain
VNPSVRRKSGERSQRQVKAPASQKAEPKSGAKAKPKRKAKAKGRQQGGPTHEARARASGLIDPNVGIVAKDPLRVQILSIATHRQIAPSEFAREAGIALNVASYHFRVLRKHGFLEIVAEVPVRGSTKHMHIATKSGFISDADWGQVEQALRPGVAGQILQDFNGRVSQAMETGTLYTRDDACLYWAPGSVDEIAWPELVSMIAWAIEESKRFQVETVERRANGDSQDSFPVTFAIAGFPSPTSAQVKQAKKRGGKKRKPAQSKGKPKCKGGKADVRRQGRKGNGP